MLTKERAIVRQAQTADFKSISFAAFAKEAETLGYSKMFENLSPKNGGAPTIGFTNGTEDVLVVLSRGIAKSLADKVISKKDLLGCQVIDGKNAAGEQRYYLALNGRTEFDTAEVRAAAEEYVKAKVSNTMADVSALWA